jgi:hypothetical protein
MADTAVNKDVEDLYLARESLSRDSAGTDNVTCKTKLFSE